MKHPALTRAFALVALTAGCGAPRRAPAPPALRPAPDRAVLSGRIRAKRHQESLQGAFVRLLAANGASRDSARIGARGTFAFIDVVPGAYVLDVTVLGFLRVRSAITLVPDGTSHMEVTLHPSPVGLIADCISPDRRSMGRQYCR